MSSFDITNVGVANLWGLFDGLRSLEKLNISSFDLSAYENASTDIGISTLTVDEIITPKNLNIGTKSIPLGKRMYAKGDSVGITRITKDTPTNTVFKSSPWN